MLRGVRFDIPAKNQASILDSLHEKFLKENGVRHRLASPYHPQSNGSAEGVVKSFKIRNKELKVSSGNQSGVVLVQVLHHTTHHDQVYFCSAHVCS